MNPNIAIKAVNISKQYRLGEVGTGTLSHDLNRFWARLRGKEDPFLKIGESNDRTAKGESEYVWSLRDINIAFVNELAKIFNLMDINTHDVLEAASTKWNFLPFKPGLVCGHCIGVDPYYLAQKAQEYGYHPEIILAGRRLNDSMGEYVASQVVKCMIKKGINVSDAEVLMLGVTFKENCPDVRNTKIVDVIRALESYSIKVTVYDPWANPTEVEHEYGVESIQNMNELNSNEYKFDAIVLGVAHKEFKDLDLENVKKENAAVYDVKGILHHADAKL